MGIQSLSAVANKIHSSIRERGLLATVKKCVAEIEDLRFDRRFHVDTEEPRGQSVHNTGEAYPYLPTKVAVFRESFSRLALRYETFTFMDAGSGKGRVLLLASSLPFRRILGVEIVPELHEVA